MLVISKESKWNEEKVAGEIQTEWGPKLIHIYNLVDSQFLGTVYIRKRCFPPKKFPWLGGLGSHALKKS